MRGRKGAFASGYRFVRARARIYIYSAALLLLAALPQVLLAAACDTTKYVKKAAGAGDHQSIQAAVDAVPSTLTGNYCIYVDSDTYTEAVFITGKNPTPAYRLTIQSDPGMVGTFTLIVPPGGSGAGFEVQNASVTIANFMIRALNTVNYGVVTSSFNVVLSSVNVDSANPGRIQAAGMSLAGQNFVTNSSVTIRTLDVSAMYLEGSTATTVAFSTAQNNSATVSAVYLDGASSNTFTSFLADNPLAGNSISLTNGSHFNSVIRSTISANDADSFPLWINASSSNTITRSYIRNPVGWGAFIDGGSEYNEISDSTAAITNNNGRAAVYVGGASYNRFIRGYFVNTTGHGFTFDDAHGNSISQSTMTGGTAYFAGLIFVTGSSSNTVTDSYIQNLAGYGVQFGGGSTLNTVSGSTMVSKGNAGNAALLVEEASSSNTITGSMIVNPFGHGAFLLTGAHYNTISLSTITANHADYNALYLEGSDGNAVTGSYLQNQLGKTMRLDDSHHSLISGSTIMTDLSWGPALELWDSDTNTVTGSMIKNTGYDGLWVQGGSVFNTVSLSTVIGTGSGDTTAVYLDNASSTTISGTYMYNPLSTALVLLNLSNYNSVKYSTMVSGSSGDSALYLNNADRNTIADSMVVNPTGYGAYLEVGSNFNTIIRSTMATASAGANVPGLYVIGSDSNNILDSYVTGSTAAIITNSDSVVFGGSTLVGADIHGNALFFESGTHLTVTTGTLKGGSGRGAALSVANGYLGAVKVTTTTITGGGSGVFMGTPGGGSTLFMSSITLSDLSPAATGVRFRGGVIVSTLAGFGFNDSDIDVNVNGALLTGVSRVTMRTPTGVRSGEAFEVDAGNKVYWLDPLQPPGTCTTTKYVKKAAGAGDHQTIQDAVDSVPATVIGDYCIFVDSSPYSESVVIANKDTRNLYRLKILSDPAMLSTATPIIPPVNSTAAFVVWNASVTIGGFNVISTNSVSYGVLASSANIFISSVNVDSGGNVKVAGMLLGSHNTLSNSSVTVQAAHGISLPAASSMTTVSYSTAQANGGGTRALYLNGADSNTVTGSYIHSLAGHCAYLESGADYNRISQSTMVSSDVSTSGLYIQASDSNTVTGSYIQNLAGYGARLNSGSDYNSISQSTMVSNNSTNRALAIQNSASNTVTGSYIQNLAGYSAYLTGADYNSISQSTMVSNAAGGFAFFLPGDSNTVTGSYMQNLAGYGAYLTGADYNSISESTMVSNSSSLYALYINADSNMVRGSYIQNLAGYGAYLTGADFNTIIRSTMISASATADRYALFIIASSSNSVLDSYIQGSTAAFISNSTGTVIGGSVLVATHTTGGAFYMSGGVNLTLASSTLRGGTAGTALGLGPNVGQIFLSTITVVGGARGLELAAPVTGLVLAVTSVTLANVEASGVGLRFLGGVHVTTVTAMAFSDADINVNVDGAALSAGSRVTMRQDAGEKRGFPYEADPSGYVDWPDYVLEPPGTCTTTRYVKKAAGAGDHQSIQAAVDAVPATVYGDYCIFVDSSPYSETVVIANKNTQTLYRLKILSDPAMVSTATPIIPPLLSTAAFVVWNASVTIGGFNVISTNSVSYGVYASSGWVSISSVNVDSGGNIGYAGVKLSSWSLIENSSITVQNAHGIWLDAAAANARVRVSTALADSGAANALFINGADSGTVTGSYIQNLAGYGAYLGTGSDYNTISQSTIVSNAGGGRALYLLGADSNTVTGSYMQNLAGYGASLDTGSDYNTISQSTMVSNAPSYRALYLNAADSNTVTGSYIQNLAGNGAFLTNGSEYNTISQSTMVSNATNMMALYLNGVDRNTVTDSYMQSLAGYGAFLASDSDYNTISQSTMVSNSASYRALYLNASDSNTVTGSYIQNLAGDGAYLTAASAYNTISQSTMVSDGVNYRALFLTNADGNTVTGSYMESLEGHGAWLASDSKYNTIIRSTMTSVSATANRYGLQIVASSSNTVLDSYVQGSTAVFITGSTGTVIGGSVLVATSTTGSALYFQAGVNLTVASSTLRGGTAQRALGIAAGNAGRLEFSTITVVGGGRGLELGAFLPGADLAVTSVTLAGAEPTGTGVHFLGGVVVATITAAAFDDAGIGVNVDGSALSAGSRVTMREDAGTKTGPAYESDPSGYVDWPDFTIAPPGTCNLTRTVKKTPGAGDHTSIQAAVDAIPANVYGDYCIHVDSSPYSESVVVANKNTQNLYRIKILSDPAMVSTATPIIPPLLSTAAFVIANASVTIGGFNVRAENPVTFGVYAASASIVISSVNVDGYGNVTDSGMLLLSHVTVSRSSVTVGNAYGFQLLGGTRTTVSHSTALVNALNLAAFNVTADSNTVADSHIENLGGRALRFNGAAEYNSVLRSTVIAAHASRTALDITSGDYNSVSQSYIQNLLGNALQIITGNGNSLVGSTVIARAANKFAVRIDDSDLVEISGSYVENLDGDALSLESNSNLNSIVDSTLVSDQGGYAALYITASDSNTVTGSTIRNLLGNAAHLRTGSEANVISLSTMVSAAGAFIGYYLNASHNNTVTGSYIQNLTGTAAAFQNGADKNTISQSTMVANGAGDVCLYLDGSDSNTVTGSYAQNLLGDGIAIYLGADNNTIIRSTVVTDAADRFAIVVASSAYAGIFDSYVQGASAVYVTGSTGTVIGGSYLVAANPLGNALDMAGGSVGLLVATSTVRGGRTGLVIEPGSSGQFSVTTVTVVGGARAVEVGTPGAGMSLFVSSLTLADLDPASTAIRFTGGVYVSTFSGVAFDDAGIGVNVDGAGLLAGSRVSMRDDAGTKTGPSYENDPSGYVDWPDYVPAPPGTCETTRTVKKAPGAGDHASIQAAVDAIPATVYGDYCIHVDSSPYSESVVIANKNTQNLYRIKILSDPAMLSTATPIIPPVMSTAAFVIWNASVTIGGFNVISTNSVSYGVLASSANIVISSVNVDSGGNVKVAGMQLGSQNTLSNSSVTVQNAYGLYLANSSMTSVASSSAQANGLMISAWYLLGASSNAFTLSLASNPAGSAAVLDDGSTNNAISLSSMVSSLTGDFGLALQGAVGNTVTGSYIQNLAGDAAYMDSNSAHNTISQSTMVSNAGGYIGLNLFGDSNTVTGSYMQSLAGYGAYLQSGADHNVISLSTMVSNHDSYRALYLGGADSNTVTGSYIQNLAGDGALLNTGADYNTISQSTMVSNVAAAL
ncbi:MAG: right-handed parallel beta-helix repeat-containing protein [Elusimicrobia bacterium]|nr:right-handed parallel beta-helix repeat-containing protein [Elusimicrobiota bacterium]